MDPHAVHKKLRVTGSDLRVAREQVRCELLELRKRAAAGQADESEVNAMIAKCEQLDRWFESWKRAVKAFKRRVGLEILSEEKTNETVH
ncbi:MAG: hypothetical protein R6V12_15790 [Candidatus Hydrogenedentota bacterium]